jgi:hypothetical protein
MIKFWQYVGIFLRTNQMLVKGNHYVAIVMRSPLKLNLSAYLQLYKRSSISNYTNKYNKYININIHYKQSVLLLYKRRVLNRTTQGRTAQTFKILNNFLSCMMFGGQKITLITCSWDKKLSKNLSFYQSLTPNLSNPLNNFKIKHGTTRVLFCLILFFSDYSSIHIFPTIPSEKIRRVENNCFSNLFKETIIINKHINITS